MKIVAKILSGGDKEKRWWKGQMEERTNGREDRGKRGEIKQKAEGREDKG